MGVIWELRYRRNNYRSNWMHTAVSGSYMYTLMRYIATHDGLIFLCYLFKLIKIAIHFVCQLSIFTHIIIIICEMRIPDPNNGNNIYSCLLNNERNIYFFSSNPFYVFTILRLQTLLVHLQKMMNFFRLRRLQNQYFFYRNDDILQRKITRIVLFIFIHTERF